MNFIWWAENNWDWHTDVCVDIMIDLQIIVVKNALNMPMMIVISRPASLFRLRWRGTEFILRGLLFNKNFLINLFQVTLNRLVSYCFSCIANIKYFSLDFPGNTSFHRKSKIIKVTSTTALVRKYSITKAGINVILYGLIIMTAITIMKK